MQTFMIKKLRVSGAGKIDGVVEFTDGLNFIQGRSNTGKTWILRCINYLFGADKRPYTPATGYTDIEGTFVTERFLGLDEDDEELDQKTIRNGLYEYIIHNRGRGQIIIVDNLNALPDMDFEDEDVNVIIYHKNEKDGHVYGFMPSWRKDIPKEK